MLLNIFSTTKFYLLSTKYLELHHFIPQFLYMWIAEYRYNLSSDYWVINTMKRLKVSLDTSLWLLTFSWLGFLFFVLFLYFIINWSISQWYYPFKFWLTFHLYFTWGWNIEKTFSDGGYERYSNIFFGFKMARKREFVPVVTCWPSFKWYIPFSFSKELNKFVINLLKR